jgi:hypothetical protein
MVDDRRRIGFSEANASIGQFERRRVPRLVEHARRQLPEFWQRWV